MHPIHLSLAVALAVAPALAGACDRTTPTGLAACVDAQTYAKDLRELARTPRQSGTEGLYRAEERCVQTLARAGFERYRGFPPSGVRTEYTFVGMRKGTDPSRPAVLIGAHMDSVPRCKGANDNASGTAAVLELGRVLSGVKHAADIYLACWDAEEQGYVGSSRWVAKAKAKGLRFDVAINLDQIGNRRNAPDSQAQPPPWSAKLFPEATRQIIENQRRGDFVMFVWDSTVEVTVWDQMVRAGGVRMLRGVMPREPGQALELPKQLNGSDHVPFWRAGYPAMFITDTTPLREGRYHCQNGPDDIDGVDVEFAVGVVRALAVYVGDRVGLRAK